jgi:hypothetical protein
VRTPDRTPTGSDAARSAGTACAAPGATSSRPAGRVDPGDAARTALRRGVRGRARADLEAARRPGVLGPQRGGGADADRHLVDVVGHHDHHRVQIYVFRAGELLETAAASAPGRSTRIAPYTHLVLLVGVAVTAASIDLVVNRPTGTTPTRWLMLIIGGPLVFVLGRALFTYLLSSRVPWRRVATQLLPLLLLPWAGGWPPVLVTAIVALALAGHVLPPAPAKGRPRGGSDHEGPTDDPSTVRRGVARPTRRGPGRRRPPTPARTGPRPPPPRH